VTTDPLDALRLPIVPVEPRPEFTDALLRRITGASQLVPADTAADRPAPAEPAPAEPVPAQPGTGPVQAEPATVRYFVDDLDAAVSFYCGLLGFEAELRSPPAFALLYRGDLRLLLSVPGLHGAGRALPDGTLPEPGGWNRIALAVPDLPAAVEALRSGGARFRHDIVTGVGVTQIVLQDPSGNLIELFQPAAGYRARRSGGQET
jgi:catechol 2,3-dioxygenase-like lactoylglutathione lyase family enzyme